ncbi:hypothetical protein LguiB_008714 [Lonicera macranthoides]
MADPQTCEPVPVARLGGVRKNPIEPKDYGNEELVERNDVVYSQQDYGNEELVERNDVVYSQQVEFIASCLNWEFSLRKRDTSINVKLIKEDLKS